MMVWKYKGYPGVSYRRCVVTSQVVQDFQQVIHHTRDLEMEQSTEVLMWSVIRGYSHPSATSMICSTDVGKWVLRKGEKKERSMLCLKTQASSPFFSFSLLPVKTPLL